MAQEGSEEQMTREDPLVDVKDEIEHGSPHLKHVDRHEKAPEDVQMEDLVQSEVPMAFVEELKDDHSMTEPVYNLAGTSSGFMRLDPMHDVKQEIESGSPHLKHVENLPTESAPSQEGDVVKSQVPEAFVEELKNDHDIVKGAQSDEAKPEEMDTDLKANTANVRPRTLPGRGTPHFRISAHHGMRPGGTLARDLPEKQEGSGEDFAMDVSKPEEFTSKPFNSAGVAARGTPSFRISAHHGMRPGGPLSRDLNPETSETGSGEGAGTDLSGDVKPKGPGLRRGSAPRRGGLARKGSGVPGESKGGLARQGSGVPGNSLARTGSGVPGGGLGRTGSGVPSFGGSDLKDLNSFLESRSVGKAEKQDVSEPEPVPEEETSHDGGKGLLGKFGEKWNQLNTYPSNTPAKADEASEDASASDVLTKESYLQTINDGIKDQAAASKAT